ncbi:VOC family protein [Citrobacter braakii]|jgi:PhnB protein|uniref:VOC family protein n=1 Tax=Citrobacter braakii TaxID=57706 RepID=UPI00068C9F2F|nr:VOC family protein [Citrobacter braakii]EIV2905994.1 VOC family protein [Citrobacter braakii]ELN2652946.1 VOC family protein [Citrobacter braakii]MBJ8972109.1 VOC family protein [Citrobacter braakii]POT33524.1 VOC family protein [Citrobacter braakii]POT38353.1 VOC family protein [Citrobacter braakii]
MKIDFGLSVKNSAEAVELYQKAFGVELGYHVKNPDGSYFHSELSKDGHGFSVVEGQGEAAMEHTVTLGVTLADESEVQKAYKHLAEGGTIKESIGPLPWSPCAVTVIDRFGVLWYITAPQHRPPDDYDPNMPWDPSMYKKPE